MYHIFMTHSSIDGQQGYFQLLAIINRAAMEQVFYSRMQSPVGIFPRVG